MLHPIGTITQLNGRLSGMAVYFDDANASFVLADQRPIVASLIARLDAEGEFHWLSDDGRAWFETVMSASHADAVGRDAGSAPKRAIIFVCATGGVLVLAWLFMLGTGDPWAALGPVFLSALATPCYLLALILAMNSLGRVQYVPEDSPVRFWVRAQFFVCVLVGLCSLLAVPATLALVFYLAPVPVAAFVGSVVGALGANGVLRVGAVDSRRSFSSFRWVLVCTLVALVVLPNVAAGIWNYTQSVKSNAKRAAMGPAGPGTAPDRWEPDETTATAHVLTVGGPAEDHTLSSPSDVDWFAVDFPGDGQYIDVDLGAPEAVDTYMYTDAAGGIARDYPLSRVFEFFPVPYRATETFVAPNKQRWYIRVQAPAWAKTPYAYRIRVHGYESL